MTKIDIEKYPDTIKAFDGNRQRATVFLDRYAMKDENGDPVEDVPSMMWHRVAAEIANTDEEFDRFLNLLTDFKFVPGGRILAGAGTDTEVTYYNCYVIPVETEVGREIRRAVAETGEPLENFDTDSDEGRDSRRAIFDTIGRMVDIMSRGGGVGINWSVLRPQGAYLKTVNGTASGPVGWMDVASTAVGEVEQGGSRRGAAMFMLDDWHPDVERFIEEKRDLTKIKNANVSVAVSDEFMKAVMMDADWGLQFPDTSHPAYNTEWDGDIYAWSEKYPDAVKLYKRVRARDLWRKMAQMAWDNGEPGVVFLDRYNQLSTGLGVERIISVNPCGEQGLGPYSVCNLGAINLDAYVTYNWGRMRHADGTEDPKFLFDWTALKKDVRTAVRFLDNVIDKNHYFIPENERAQKDLRRIGLGVMGLADALIGLGWRYGSTGAVNTTENIFEAMRVAALRESNELAIEKGPAPAWRPEMADRPYIKWLEQRDPGLYQSIKQHGLRNLFLLTQAPTGTTSILAGVNSGIEPYFAFGYWRNDRTGKHWVPAPAQAKYGIDFDGRTGENKPFDDFWVTANEVTVEEHIAMQAAAQKHIDSSVSKTINAPNSHTVEDVEKAYTLAYESGLKGLAYFRDGCGRQQVLTREDPGEKVRQLEEKVASLEAAAEAKPKPYKRGMSLAGRTWKQNTAVGHVYVTINRDRLGAPKEVFINAGKAGSDVMVMGEALGRVISLGLQNGTGINQIVSTLSGVGGRSKMMPSLPNAVAVSLLEDEEATRDAFGAPLDADQIAAELSTTATMSHTSTGQLCPECQSFSVVLEEGCSKCHVCGYSAC